ncbi:ubiquitin family protein, putative (macronuclear) [Tetrahymena thermophila SB210]|uniref:Ubiquitin family protein, putative n=1 Tax=Tetrahymena thermophila (strain SB210) TaxID=312017 RepID=W7XG26_TETTS|nr:ubiquitin family protein, putative [Tetrahymena thermophila SB210]EWS71784.1 ubiquitin family protein, putative [Tetrahymena thermophila SB210]|eukprot:XP_012655671.1 ubiquitin family protein, putative [Tetrahymena thermophila SB210]
MNQIETQEQNQIDQCSTHKGYPIQFFNTNLSTDTNQIGFCSRCVTKNLLQGKDLLFYADIAESSDTEILTNWPIMEDKSILSNLKNTLNEQKECFQDELQTIELFIEELQYKLNQKILKMKKAAINYLSDKIVTKSRLLEVYQNISCKKEFQNYIQQMLQGNKQGLEQINNLIKESHKNRIQNQQIIQEEFQKFQESNQFLQLKFPKLIQKQIFQKLKLIKHYFLDNHLRNDKIINIETQNNIEDFQDYISQCASPYVQHIDSLKDLQFNHLSNPQFEYIIQTAQFQIQKNQYISQLNENQFSEQSLSSFKNIEKLTKDFQNLTQEFNKKQQLIMNELMFKHKYELDATENYQFIKSLKDNYSQTNQIIKKSKEGLTKIKQKSSQLMVQFFTEKAIDPSKKYTIQFEFKPFIGDENSYKIAIGVIQKSKCNQQWLDQENLSLSDLFFSNHVSNKFNLSKKGYLFNNSQIRRSELMRKLEFQFCLQDKFFQIADYPDYKNVTQAKEEEVARYQSSQEYVFGIEHYSIKSIKILKFVEGFMINN